MCLFFAILLLGPRIGILFWWIAEPGRWDAAFTTVIWPLLGFVFMPWTTLMFVAVAPFGNIAGWDWMWLAFAAFADIASWSGGGYSNRYRMGYA